MTAQHVIMSVTPKNNPDEFDNPEELVFIEVDRHHDFNTAMRKLATVKKKNPTTRYTIIEEYEL